MKNSLANKYNTRENERQLSEWATYPWNEKPHFSPSVDFAGFTVCNTGVKRDITITFFSFSIFLENMENVHECFGIQTK